jgi:TPR repeat protein
VRNWLISLLLLSCSTIVFADCNCIQQAKKDQLAISKCKMDYRNKQCHDPDGARKIIQKLVKKQNPDAQYILGYWHLIGANQVEQDYQKAFQYISKAATKKVVPAYHELGWLYESGNGTKKNLDKAKKYYQTALDKGDTRGKLGLKRVELANLKIKLGKK